jgi:pyruvate/2-oxoacid:ferredoxin oxidoreductase alpha subunit
MVTNCKPDNYKDPHQDTNRYELDSTSQYYDRQYRVYTLEDCEYIIVGYGKEKWGSHKGNCKNPIHECK